ncbi:MAG: sulfotransferase, partial [Gammaproteobacteria bacterium]
AIAQREGRGADAERACRRVLQAEPGNVDALRLLGQLALAAGRMSDGERLLRRAVELAPDFHAVLVDLGRLLKDLDRFAEAAEVLGRAAALAPQDAQSQFLLGSVLAPCGAVEEAAHAYRRTIALEPEDAAAWLGLGHALKTLGQTAEGVEAYRRCIALRPGNGEGWWSLANLKTYRFDAAEVARMEALAAAEATDETSRINVLFSLAKATEDQRDFDSAWRWYAQGNARARQRLSYDPVQTQQAHDALVEVFDMAFLAERSGWGDPDPAPIFVLGLPRSGSTLIEQILASHSAVEGTSELPYIGRLAGSLGRERGEGHSYPQILRELDAPAVRALGAAYLERAAVHRRQGRPRFVDKMPNNFPNAGFIALIL